MSDTGKSIGPPGLELKLTPARLLAVLAIGFILTLLEIEALEYAYDQLRIPHRYFLTLLLLSFFGSMLNLPLMRLPAATDAKDSAGTVVAINVGGAIIPVAISIWVLGQQASPGPALIVAALVAGVSYASATPIKGIGIAMPMLVPALTAAGSALLLSPGTPAAAAYIGGTLGTLVGADLLHFARIRELGAPLVSIGGAGTFDGVFLSGLIAVLLAAL